MKGMIVLKGGETELSGAPTTIKLIPLGAVKSQKGNFLVDQESFQLMKQQFESRGIDIVIDYEHQTLQDVQAPAGGWIKKLYMKDDAITADVEWTPKAKEYLANKEYRYLSPVILVRDSDRKAIVLHSAALTNTPAIDNMFPIINSLSIDQQYEGGNTSMNEFLKKLAKLLGLGEDATEEAVLEKLQTAISTPAAGAAGQGGELVANKTLLDLLGVPETAKTEDVAAAILAMKAPAQQIETDFRALKLKWETREAETSVSTAIQTGKITPAQKEWATTYALKDPTGFASFVEKAPQVVPLGELAHSPGLDKSLAYTDESTLQVCKMMGLTKEDVEKYGKGDQ